MRYFSPSQPFHTNGFEISKHAFSVKKKIITVQRQSSSCILEPTEDIAVYQIQQAQSTSWKDPHLYPVPMVSSPDVLTKHLLIS